MAHVARFLFSFLIPRRWLRFLQWFMLVWYLEIILNSLTKSFSHSSKCPTSLPIVLRSAVCQKFLTFLSPNKQVKSRKKWIEVHYEKKSFVLSITTGSAMYRCQHKLSQHKFVVRKYIRSENVPYSYEQMSAVRRYTPVAINCEKVECQHLDKPLLVWMPFYRCIINTYDSIWNLKP